MKPCGAAGAVKSRSAAAFALLQQQEEVAGAISLFGPAAAATEEDQNVHTVATLPAVCTSPIMNIRIEHLRQDKENISHSRAGPFWACGKVTPSPHTVCSVISSALVQPSEYKLYNTES